jgi:hypothetical protein
MTVEQCARELANLVQSGQPLSVHRVSALIHSCLEVPVRDILIQKRHQLAVAFRDITPDSEQRELILKRILPEDD